MAVLFIAASISRYGRAYNMTTILGIISTLGRRIAVITILRSVLTSCFDFLENIRRIAASV